MAYKALIEMQKKNTDKYKEYGQDIGPKQPPIKEVKEDKFDLKSAAIHFLHNSCENLRFDGKIAEEEKNTGELKGVSQNNGQIPYNMQMDIDRLCLERAIERFVDSGVAHDAFDVYFCYLEMFVGEYGKSRRMIELLSEFETNSSSLLMKHRDHYSHSVYVFILGLAIYETNKNYRDAYKEFYGFDKIDTAAAQKSAHHYLQYWGLASLFHDIGYPFELPFEQVASYFEEGGKERSEMPFISFNRMDSYSVLDSKAKDILKSIYPDKEFNSTNEIYAYEIASKLGDRYESTMKLISDKLSKKDPSFDKFTNAEDYMNEILCKKSTNPDIYNYFMDHAFFSAAVLGKELLQEVEKERFTKAHIDALTAIILHNSLYKFSVTDWKDKSINQPFDMELHPIAFMLMLCDELQCWDRTSYGRNSRTELHPMECEFSFCNNSIQATYLYDEAESKKIIEFWKNHDEYLISKLKDSNIKAPKLKAYSSMVNENEFKADIESIVDLKQIPLNVTATIKKADNSIKHTYLSDSNFIHLYNFAVALNAQYNGEEESGEQMQNSFNLLSLEYKLSNVLQAKKFAEYLNVLGYFYTDRPVAYDMVMHFTDAELIKLGEQEHKRWEEEKKSMSWMPTGAMADKCKDKVVREQTRMHNDFEKAFDTLDEETKAKDMKPLNTMIIKLKEYDGLRIYSLNLHE
jgi:hypothetical protein